MRLIDKFTPGTFKVMAANLGGYTPPNIIELATPDVHSPKWQEEEIRIRFFDDAGDVIVQTTPEELGKLMFRARTLRRAGRVLRSHFQDMEEEKCETTDSGSESA